MKTPPFTAIALAAALAATLSTPAAAHHAVNAQFDVTQTLQMTGTLEKTELINPHSYLHFKAPNAAGQSVEWSMETGTPAAMKRSGIVLRDAFKVGDKYTIFYSPSRNGAPVGILHAMVLSDGRFVGMGSALNIEAARAMAKK
jgi:hypothetical protein